MTQQQIQRARQAEALARLIVQSYRDHAPRGCDPQNIEGWAAAAVAVAAVGASAYSAYSQSSASQAEASAASHQPGVVPYTPVDPTQSFNDYQTYRNSVLPQANADATANNTYNNAAYQAGLSRTSPYLLANVSQQGNVANQLLNGQIPTDVAQQVQRSSAFQSLSGGTYGSGASHALTARDLGLTSLQLQQEGSAMAGQNASLTAALNPSNETGDSTIMNPSQFLSREDSNNAYQNAVLNRNRQIQYQNSLYATQAANINPLANAGVAGVGALSSAYFGGMGGGGAGSALGGLMNSYGGGSGGGGLVYGSDEQNATSGYYNPYLDPDSYSANGTYVGSLYGAGG